MIYTKHDNFYNNSSGRYLLQTPQAAVSKFSANPLSLTDLPQELIRHSFEFCSLQDHFKLQRTCKTFNCASKETASITKQLNNRFINGRRVSEWDKEARSGFPKDFVESVGRENILSFPRIFLTPSSQTVSWQTMQNSPIVCGMNEDNHRFIAFALHIKDPSSGINAPCIEQVVYQPITRGDKYYSEIVPQWTTYPEPYCPSAFGVGSNDRVTAWYSLSQLLQGEIIRVPSHAMVCLRNSTKRQAWRDLPQNLQTASVRLLKKEELEKLSQNKSQRLERAESKDLCPEDDQRFDIREFLDDYIPSDNGLD